MKIKIELIDEVNSILRGVPPDLLKKLRSELTFYVPNYMHTPKYKAGWWDGTICLMTKTGVTRIGHLPTLFPIIERAGHQIDLVDHRADWSSVTDQIKLVDENFHDGLFWTKTGEPIKLRDYQVEAINTSLKAGQGIIQLATAGGKSITVGTIAKIYSQFGNVVVIVPTIQLALQTRATFRQIGINCGIWYGEEHDRQVVTMATWQSLDHFEELLDGVVCICVDECFDGETPVLTNQGWKPIRTITPDDVVLTYDETDQTWKYNRVLKRHENLLHTRSEKFYEMEFDDGTILKVTGNHKFLTNLGWIRADELSEEHEIISVK